jgi:hypothetical protein
MSNVRQRPSLPARRYVVGLAMALAFALAQFGALMHELSHLRFLSADLQTSKNFDPQDPRTTAPEACETCFSFSHIAVGAEAPVFIFPLLGGLTFATVAAHRFFSAVRPLPPQRAQGPPRRP